MTAQNIFDELDLKYLPTQQKIFEIKGHGSMSNAANTYFETFRENMNDFYNLAVKYGYINPELEDVMNEDSSNQNDISDIVRPDAPTTTNDKGGSQSYVPVRFDLFDAASMFEMAKVLHVGAEKYGEDNWRLIDVEDHLNHLLMHTFAYLAGDATDDHLSHALCRAMFALGVHLGLDDLSINEVEDY